MFMSRFIPTDYYAVQIFIPNRLISSGSPEFSNIFQFVLKTKVTDKTWLNTFQFQDKFNLNDALNLFKVLKCIMRFRDSEVSVP